MNRTRAATGCLGVKVSAWWRGRRRLGAAGRKHGVCREQPVGRSKDYLDKKLPRVRRTQRQAKAGCRGPRPGADRRPVAVVVEHRGAGSVRVACLVPEVEVRECGVQDLVAMAAGVRTQRCGPR